MTSSRIVLEESDFERVRSILTRTQQALRAELVLLVDRSGQQVAAEGPAHDIDLTALSSLAAANLAATDGLARLVGEPAFSLLYHQGHRRSIHISSILDSFCLVLVFGESVSLALVRLRVKHATAYLEELFRLLGHKVAEGGRKGKELDFTDEEIDRLFGN